MSWIEAALILFGGLVAVMGLGVPVAFAFLAINVVGAALFLGGEPGLAQLARNAVQSITSFSLTPIPFFVLMGEVLFHSGVALKAIDAFALLMSKREKDGRWPLQNEHRGLTFFRMESPGKPMTRFTRSLIVGSIGFPSEPFGVLNTTMSPRWTACRWYESLLTMTRSSVLSVGTIESDGM